MSIKLFRQLIDQQPPTVEMLHAFRRELLRQGYSPNEAQVRIGQELWGYYYKTFGNPVQARKRADSLLRHMASREVVKEQPKATLEIYAKQNRRIPPSRWKDFDIEQAQLRADQDERQEDVAASLKISPATLRRRGIKFHGKRRPRSLGV